MVINTTTQPAATLDACKKRGQHGRRQGMLSAGHPEHSVKVMIVEVGYTSETRYAEKLQEKMTQPEKLQSALSRAGFGLILLPVMIGTTGGIFNSNLDSLLYAYQMRELCTSKIHYPCFQGFLFHFHFQDRPARSQSPGTLALGRSGPQKYVPTFCHVLLEAT